MNIHSQNVHLLKDKPEQILSLCAQDTCNFCSPSFSGQVCVKTWTKKQQVAQTSTSKGSLIKHYYNRLSSVRLNLRTYPSLSV